jgi:class 3 adenylate cyclase/tetratricopeptide (TPR) repeat protein
MADADQHVVARGEEHSRESLTIMFEDLEGSTALATARGDEVWRGARRFHEDVVRREIGAHGGREIQFLGDGFLASFPSCQRAVECAAAIQHVFESQDRRDPSLVLKVRIGLHSGEVIQEGQSLIGAAVNAAARISAKAKGGQILVSGIVRDLSGTMPGVSFVDRGLYWLKGFSDRWRLFEAMWQERKEAASNPPTDGSARFVGRDSEQADIRRLLERAENGGGGLVLIGGEAGVGKSRLAVEAMADAERIGMLGLVGHCYEMEAPPYIPFVEMLEAAIRVVPPETMRDALGETAGEVARLLPELPRLFPGISQPISLPPEQARRYLYNSIVDFVDRAARGRPMVLILEDLHWADESTLLLMQHLSRRVAEMPVLVIATYRDTELEPTGLLGGVLEDLVRHHLATRVQLRPLSKESVATMLDALAGHQPPRTIIDAVYRETEGNAFFVEEVFRHLVEEGKLFDGHGKWREELTVSEMEVPDSVRLVLGRRIGRLSEGSRRVLSVAAVVGRGLSLKVVEAVDEADSDALLDGLEEAERARLVSSTLQDSEVFISFSHELVRQQLLGALPNSRRRRLHARVADALETIHGTDLGSHAADIAYHLLQAGATDREKISRYLVMAAEGALEAAAYEDALRHLEAALALHVPGDPAGDAFVLFRLGVALRSLGRWDEATARWEQAMTAYERLDDSEAVGRVSWEAANQSSWAGRWERAVEMAGRGLTALEGRTSAERGRLLGIAGIAFSSSGYEEAGAQMIEEAMTLADQLHDQRLLADVLGIRVVHLFNYLRTRELIDTGLRTAELHRANGSSWDLVQVLGFVSLHLVFAGEPERAMQVTEDAEPIARRLGHHGASLLMSRTRFLESLRGADIDWSRRYAVADLELCRSADMPWIGQSHIFLGLIDFWRGRWEESLERFKEGVRHEVAAGYVGMERSFVFLCTSYLGRLEEARRILDERFPEIPRPGEPIATGAGSMVLGMVEGLMALGLRDEAAPLYPLVLQLMDLGNVLRPYDTRIIESVAGMAAWAGEEWDVAEGHFRASLVRAELLSHRLEVPTVRYWYGRMLLERGRPGDRELAIGLLDLSVEGFRSIGMPRHEALATGLRPAG